MESRHFTIAEKDRIHTRDINRLVNRLRGTFEVDNGIRYAVSFDNDNAEEFDSELKDIVEPILD